MWQKQVVKSSLWLSLKHQFETNYWMGKSSCWMTFCWCTGWTGGAVCLLLTVRVDRHRGGSWVASRASHELKQMPREVQFFHWISGRIIFPSVLTWIISFTLVRLFKKKQRNKARKIWLIVYQLKVQMNDSKLLYHQQSNGYWSDALC